MVLTVEANWQLTHEFQAPEHILQYYLTDTWNIYNCAAL